MKCPACGTENPEGQKFCGECAAPLVSGRAGESAASETLPTPGTSADRRPVTVLFADISGFTSLSETLDPEAVQDLIGACFERVVPCIERYGGTIDKFIGDEVMALFGAPQAHENDPERALRAALEMREALVGFNRERGADLSIHFGVNTGLVYAGEVGGGSRHDYSVMGDAVNVAARLKAAAPPGEILVGADTYHQTEHLFDFTTSEALSLKGKAQPVSVCRLVCARSATLAGERLSRGLSSPLVGRDAEVASFRGCLTRLRAGEGGIVILTGEAGLGKSRLVAEVRREARQQGLSWLEGRTLSFGRTISYWPLLEIIQQDSGIESDDPEAERWDKLSARITDLFGDQTPEILPYLATLHSISLPEELAQKVRLLDGEAMGRQIYRSTRLYFDRLAQAQPTTVVFEDLHWLDGSSAALLEHLLPLTRESSILFCLVSRPEQESPLSRLQELTRADYSERLTEIDLAPLSAEESTRLVCNLAHLDDLPSHLQEAITARTEGNPFYVEEVVRSLIDQGGLIRDPGNGRYRVTDKAAHISIPDTLLEVITARIDRLDEDLKQVLRLASVVGRTFFYRVLAAIAQLEEELDKDLADLEERELIREKTRIPELEYIFKHALVQEATYESILIARRKELHRRVAEVIEALFAERLEEFYSLLAYHYSKAEDWERAQDYLFKAGDQAGSIAADAEALSHYRLALSAYEQSSGREWDPLQRAAIDRKVGEALFRLGHYDEARAQLDHALSVLRHQVPSSGWPLRRATGVQVMRQIPHLVLGVRGRGLPVHRNTRATEEFCRLCKTLGWMELYGDPERFFLVELTWLNLAEANRLEGLLVHPLTGVGVAYLTIGAPRLAHVYLRQALSVAEESNDLFDLGWAHVCLALREHYLGNIADALEHYQLAAHFHGRVGEVRGWGSVNALMTMLNLLQGRMEESLEIARELAQKGEEWGDRHTTSFGLFARGQTLDQKGGLQEGEDLLRQSLVGLAAIPDRLNWLYCAGRLVRCLVRQGKLATAAEIVDEGELILKRYPLLHSWHNFEYWIGAAQLRLAEAESQEGTDRTAALKRARVASKGAVHAVRFGHLGAMAAYRLQGTYEYLHGRPSKAQKWWQKSLEHAQKLGARYEEALTRLEIGRRTGDRSQLEAAEAAFAEMGAAFDSADARRLLGRPEPAEAEAVAS